MYEVTSRLCSLIAASTRGEQKCQIEILFAKKVVLEQTKLLTSLANNFSEEKREGELEKVRTFHNDSYKKKCCSFHFKSVFFLKRTLV